jgi:hypothetical protein
MAGLFGSKDAAGNGASSAGDGLAGEMDRRKLILLGVAVLALVAVFAVVVLPGLLGGGSSSSASGPIPTARHGASPAAVAPTPSPTPSDDFTLAPAAAYGDPFAHLPAENAAAASSAAVPSSAPTVPSAGTAAPTTGATSTTGGTAGSSTPAANSKATTASAGTPDNTPAAGKPVQVMSVKGTSAAIQIDSLTYTVQVGSVPVPGYTVKSIADGKVTVAHDGAAHTLAEGELQTF